MTPRELRRELRERKKELRRSVDVMRREARERVEQLPAVRREKQRKRLRRAVAIATLLLLAMLMRCECEPAPPAPPPEVKVEPAPQVKPKPPVPPPVSKPKAFGDKLERQRRGNYQNESRASPGWLDDFRLQVAARGPRLAQCFRGTERPGVLRWTTAVNAASGAVSDHVLEFVGASDEPSAKQRDCIVGVLSSPGYRLKPEQQQDLPGRVSLVIEF